MEITPRYEQLHFDELLRAGALRKVTVADPGAHATVTGTQGVGVKTPLAADVADAVAGFVSDEHIPNVGILVTGIASLMLAAGFLSAVTVGNVTSSVAGAAPKEHDMVAVAATNCAIIIVLSDLYVMERLVHQTQLILSKNGFAHNLASWRSDERDDDNK